MLAIENDPADLARPALITADQLASMLQISTRTVWRLKSAGQLPKPVEVGGSVRWRAEEIHNWINRGCPRTAERDNPAGRK